MTLSIGSVFDPLNQFFTERFGTPDGSPVAFRFDQFGTPVSQDDFRTNPADPASPFNPAIARERVSDLVNRVPQDVGDGVHVVLTADPVDGFYADTVLRPAQPYLPEGTTPDERDDLVDAFSGVKADALRRWEAAELTSVLGSPVGVHATEAQPVQWWNPASDEGWTLGYTLKISEPTEPAPQPSPPIAWVMLPTQLQLAKAWEQADLQQAPVVAVVEPPELLVPVEPVEPTKPDRAVLVEPKVDWQVQDLSVLKSRKLVVNQQLLVAPGIKADTARLRASVGERAASPALRRSGLKAGGDVLVRPDRADDLEPRLRLNPAVLAIRDRLRLKKILVDEVPAPPVTTNSLTITFDYCVVHLTRSWWSSLVNAPTWRIPGRPQGSLNAPGTPGGLRQLPVGFVAVRNLRIEASWSDADRAAAAGAMSFGPFDISASAGSQQVAQPGVQVVGWLLQQLPDLPPNPPTDGAAGGGGAGGGGEQPATRTHTVVAGETLAKIAKRYYGSADQFPKIQQANKIKDPSKIKVGQVLVIP